MKPITKIQKAIYDLAAIGLLPKQIFEWCHKQQVAVSRERILELCLMYQADSSLRREVELAKREFRTSKRYRMGHKWPLKGPATPTPVSAGPPAPPVAGSTPPLSVPRTDR